jgi:hypothetical protein
VPCAFCENTLVRDRIIPSDCPICTPVYDEDDAQELVLEEKCNRDQCPDFRNCWAVKQVKEPEFHDFGLAKAVGEMRG